MGTGVELSASDKRALRGLGQRNGGMLTYERAIRFLAMGLVRDRPDVLECYGRVAYSLTGKGSKALEGFGLND